MRFERKPHGDQGRRSERALRSLCRRALRGLDLDLPLDAAQLCERYGTRRGRDIKLIAYPLPTAMPNGVWLAAEDADYFFYQANTSKMHQQQIVIHEFGHLIAGHQMLGDQSSAALLAGGAPDEQDSEGALRRTCYSDDREWEAEMLASMILTWAEGAGDRVGASASDDDLRGMQRLLGGHHGWL
ncbi:hypothetical protein [Gordonia sp. (in: high G+C Gram-positive bacteria)]|jgi:hypothetical protein|uniref:hypothetical protein n=1 Tax=Gordonia sp. (in: high G+C Gram-positive bacteria) TaxID=84139 RepID=UPI001E048A57|nr:hypothetical protein [Gordonia sp. (in: high G+C Gram-positive bacteria)]MCB1293698.1 hypothetical protein [Gordonia sp. (in: high G+C Gram-positive bacteria)]HMS74406.1 hypothetical protein [Gordonia sp. (in: high G+C Gram-positive bacteria)]HQV19818.1 hypothetical protein [Gordonia sp. (in: high G+C Gram-positive bacteria)]